jgi:hypothetical protein
MFHIFADSLSLGQMVAYAIGLLSIAAALKRRAKLLRVTLPIRVKSSQKEK